MKKLVSVLLAVLMLLSITGCGKSADQGTTDFSGENTMQQESAQGTPQKPTREANNRAIACGSQHTVALKNDGTVVATGNNEYGQCNVSGWKGIVSVDAGNICTVGLKKNGTVVATGWNEVGLCDVSGWRNIVAVSCGAGFTLGLKKDGTVISTIDTQKYDLYAVEKKVAEENSREYDPELAKKEAETLEWIKHQITGWTDIVAIAAGGMHAVGLKSDGTVVAAGDSEGSQCNVGDWRNITSIATNVDGGLDFGLTIGVTDQGTIRYDETYSGYDDYWNNEISYWKNVKQVAISCGCVTALLNTGAVMSFDPISQSSREKLNMPVSNDGADNWQGIVEIAVGTNHMVGVKYDGTVVAAGWNGYGQCDVSDWTDIRVYE